MRIFLNLCIFLGIFVTVSDGQTFVNNDGTVTDISTIQPSIGGAVSRVEITGHPFTLLPTNGFQVGLIPCGKVFFSS